MKTVLEEAAIFGFRKVTVNVFATNKRAINVYEKAGFVETGIMRNRHLRQGRFIDEVVMTKLIG